MPDDERRKEPPDEGRISRRGEEPERDDRHGPGGSIDGSAENPAEPPVVPGSQKREADRRRRELARSLGEAEERKVKARERPKESVWFGLGAFGLIGWSVAIPMLLFLALGIWIDANYQSRFSWTLMMLFAGIIVGCLNAWYWVKREQAEIERRRDDSHGD